MPPASISLEELSDYFHMPEKMVAQKMGMCLTSLKKVCRAHGITRWPFRKLKSLERTMQKVNADSSSITAQLGKSGAQAARSRSTESSRAPSPMKLNCADVSSGLQPGAHAAQAHEPRQAVATTPGTPKPTFSPKAETAVRDSARCQSELSRDWPSFSISGVSMQQLIITNWSSLWTVHHLNKHIVKPLGGCELTICEDGTKAYFSFNSSLAAVQARKVCEEACDLLRARQLAAEANREGAVKCERGGVLQTMVETEECDETADVVHCGLAADPCFIETDAVRAGSIKVSDSPSAGPQHVSEDEEGIAWTVPSMPGQPFSSVAGAAGASWVSTLLSPPQSCGSQSFGSDSSGASDAEMWMSPCLVSC